MHPHIIAAAHAAAAAQSASGSDRSILAIGAAVLVFTFGVLTSRKKKPAAGK